MEHYFSGQDSNLIIIVHLIDQTATTFRLNDFIIQGISDNIHSLLNQKIVAQYLHFLQIKSAGYNIFKVTYCVRVKRFHRLKSCLYKFYDHATFAINFEGRIN